MKQFFIFFLSSLLLISCKEKSNKGYKNKPLVKSELEEKIDTYFSALTKLKKFNGVIYALKNDTEVIHKAYNLDSSKKSTTHISIESQFDIHSVSKLMSHYLIVKFELDGKLNKNQTLNEYIPDFPKGNIITIDMLLNHTSGLPRGLDNVEGDEINLSSDQIIEYAKKQELLFKPGTDTQYSNVGYEIIYFIIQKISKKTFAQCLSDEVFKPLGMKNSGAHFYLNEKNIQNLAKNHEKEDSIIVPVDNILKDELKTARIFSTAHDLNKFLNHIKIEPYASLLKNEDNVIEKSGGSDGIRVEIYTHLDHNYNFVLLCNYEEIPFQKTIDDFTKILEKKAYEIPKEINRKQIVIPESLLTKYIGTYAFSDMGNLELTFKVENKNLTIYQDGELIATLKAASENTFFDDPKEPESFEFIESENGDFYVMMGWKGVKLKGIKN